MGAIQGAASGLAQTMLGSAVAVKHLKQQEENLKESKNTAERALTNAGLSLNEKATENTIALDKSEVDLDVAGEKEVAANKNVEAWEKSYNEGTKTGKFTDPITGKPTNAQNALKNIAEGAMARANARQFREHKELEQAALLQQREFIKQQQGNLAKAGLQVDIPLTNREKQEARAARFGTKNIAGAKKESIMKDVYGGNK